MIELQNLSAGYPGREVLHGVTLTFHPGRVLALVGPNGCGKSTLLRAAAGLLSVSGGQILLDSAPLETYTPKEIARRVAFLPQSRPVPSITASRMVLHGRFPHLGYPRRCRAKDHRAAEQALAQVGGTDLSHRMVPELSGGQRQKVYLAMALAQDTATILMDEPTTYLDVGCQLEVMTLARRLAGQGRAVILVLHDLCLAMQAADEIALLAEGRLVSLGEPEELFAAGILDRVFGVALGRVNTPDGWRYYYQ